MIAHNSILSGGTLHSVMRFYSQKLRRKNLISIFSALNTRVWSFVSGICKEIASRVPLIRCVQIFKKIYRRLYIPTLSVFLLFALTFNASSTLSLTRKQDTINVIPSEVKSSVWKNAESALMQEVNERGVYQSFSKTNSAYFDTDVIPANDDSNSVLPEVQPSEQDAESVTSDGESVPDAPTDVIDATVAEPELMPDESQNSEMSEPESAPSDDSESVPQESAPSVSDDSALETLSKSFFTVLNDGRALRSLVALSLTTPTTSDVPTNTPTVIEASTENEIVAEESTATEESAEMQDAIPDSTTNVISDATAGHSDNSGITFTGFELPKLASGQFIKNVQLRLSLAAQAAIAPGMLAASAEIEYSFGKDEWVNAGAILLDDEVSNALNGGYFLFALPNISNVRELADFSVRVKIAGDTLSIERAFVDALWLQVDTETFDRMVLKERLLPEGLDRLKLPSMYEMVSTDLDFTRDELPKFALKYESQRNIAIRFLRGLFGRQLVEVNDVTFTYAGSELAQVSPQVDVTSDGLFTIQLSEADKEKLRPGEYTIEITVDEGGKLFTDAFTFQWGLLAINANQTEYTLGDMSEISLGALSPKGNTLCEAHLELYIIDPNEFISQIPVSQSGLCDGNNVIDRPDYLAAFTPDTVGTYEMYVESLSETGAVLAHTSDTFHVVDAQKLSIGRVGPTRIFPLAAYPMELTVTASENFAGELVERVPGDFVITNTDARITKDGDEYELAWDLDLSAGESYAVSYTFDAPDVSPYLYTVGPAEITSLDETVALREVFEIPNAQLLVQASVVEGEVPAEESLTTEVIEEVQTVVEEETVVPPVESEEMSASSSEEPSTAPEEIAVPGEVPSNTTDVSEVPTTLSSPSEQSEPITKSFLEHRKWQIASDAAGRMLIYWNSTTTIPSGWTCVSCTAGDDYYQRFLRGSTTAATSSSFGAATHTHTVSGGIDPTSAAATTIAVGSGSIDSPGHAHTFTPAVSATTTLPRYRQLRVLRNNSAGDPATLPTGAIVIFDTGVPTGWTRVSAQDGYFVRGEATSTITGGANTHTHTATGTIAAATGVTYGTSGAVTPGANAGHTHTITTTSASADHRPEYLEVVFGSLNATATPPEGIYSMWDGDVPLGWVKESGTGDPFNGKFVVGSSTYGGSGGTTTHSHADIIDAVSSAVSGTNTAFGGTGGVPDHTHTVDYTGFSNQANLPPYADVIYGKRVGLNPQYDQNYFRWYANTNAQTPTDAWPVGAAALEENETLTATSTTVGAGDIVRLRMSINVTVSTSTVSSIAFKLQYGAGASCASIGTWTDVGAIGSGAIWRGYNNASPSDGSTLSSTTLSVSDVFGSYEEENNTATTSNQIGVDQDMEFDWVLQQNGAPNATTYCFKVVKASGAPLATYTRYPQLITNASPQSPVLTKLFDNEKVASTSPWFEFYATDAEDDDIQYQVQIDDDVAFGSPTIDTDSNANGSAFENLVVPSDKDPFNSGETIRFITPSALTNNITYWWRVRGLDPSGANEWGAWSAKRSFTIDTSVTVSTWHQTTEEQFDTDTLVGSDATASDLVQLAFGSTTATTTSTGFDFDDGTVGNAWGSLSFSDTEPPGDIKYRLEYFDTATSSWIRIPDSVLAGNSTGFDVSPVGLTGLDTSIYNQLRIQSVLTGTSSSPLLLSWSVAWGYRVETPTITKLFPNEKIGTTTPSFVFSTTDPQGDSLTYQVQWSTDNTFTSSTTRTSDTNLGFLNVDAGGDLDPFNSGDEMKFTVQPSDALTNNTTYWWRVRARDPLGDNAYSFWTVSRSFTVVVGTSVSTWFQTTDEQFNTNILSGTQPSGGNIDEVEVATTSDEALMVYGELSVNTPRYRTWDGTSWSSELSALSVDASISYAVTKESPTREEYVLATIGTDGDVNAQVYRLGAWGNLQELTTSASNAGTRGFDVAYETLSGKALIAYCDGDADPSYYTWNGSVWTSGGTINLASANNCEWIKLASDPTSNEIMLLARDSAGGAYEAQVWNATSTTWGNSTTIGGMTDVAHEGLAVEYEESGNQALIVSSNNNNNSFSWNSWNGSAWAGAATTGLENDLEWGSLVRDVGTDNMMLCYMDENNDIGVVRWDGSAWATYVEHETNILILNNGDRQTDCVFETTAGRDGYIMHTYSDEAAGRYQTWNGSVWSGEGSVSTIQDSKTVQTERMGDGKIMSVFFDDNNTRYDFSYWNGSAWSTLQTLEDSPSVTGAPWKEPFMIAPRGPASEGTVTVSPTIEFTDGLGPYWKEARWSDTTPGSSDIKYQVQYYNGSSWQFISNTDLPGNGVGTSTSPINLANLNVTTYNKLRLLATLTCNGGACPTLQDWSVEWAEGITVSGTLKQYDQTASTTSGTVAVAVNGVLQVGKTGTVSNGAWSITNVTTFAGNIVTVFVEGAADSAEAVGVTRYDGLGDITGMTMFERHVSLGSNDATSTAFTNANIGAYDYTSDEDLFMNATGSALSICVDAGCGDAELYIKAGATYQPTGTLTTHDLENNGTLRAEGNTLTIGGSWDNNATATMATSTVIFSATTTAETIDGTGSLNNTFYNVTFGNGASTASWTPITTLSVDNNLTVSNGTLARGVTAITIGGNLSNGASGNWSGLGTTTFDGSGTKNWSDSNVTLQNVGRVVVDGTSKTIQLSENVRAQSIVIGSDDILDASTSNFDISLYSDFINNNTFIARSGEVIFNATTTNRIITAGNDAFYDLTFNGVGGSWSFTEADLLVNNDLRIATGTLTMPTGTTTLAGSFSSVGGTFAHNNATLHFTSGSSETIAASGTPFTNAFYNMSFGGAGSWAFLDSSATSSNNVSITVGTVTFPGTTFSVGGTFAQTAGAFAHNNATIKFTSASAKTIDVNGSSFNNLAFTGSGSWSFLDANVTALGSLAVSAGTVTLPSNTLTLGGSFTNAATVSHNNGTVLFNSSDTGETISLGNSTLYNMTFAGVTGGWTIQTHATTTNNFTLSNLTSFTLASGQTLSVGGVFSNSVGGASTTWTGSTLSLETGNYSLNTKTNFGDVYDTLRVKANTDIQMWNSSASTYAVATTGSLYSQDHNSVDGDLYIFGEYMRTSGTEHWSYSTDFDGTALSATTSRQVDVRFASGTTATLTASTLSILGTTTASTTLANQGNGTYTISVQNGTTTAARYEVTHLGTTGFSLLGATHVAGLSDGIFTVSTASGTALTVSSTTIDANQGLQIYRVNFSTTTAITARNVTQNIGTPASYWWFRESTGNIDGEAFDNDTGDPGSIRWDDSSLVLTISGIVYADDGITPLGAPTCDGATQNIRVRVQGGATYTGSCVAANGTYSIGGVVVVGDPVLAVYLDTNGGAQGTVITKTPTANLTNFNIYRNRVMTRHEDVAALTIADMAVWDRTDDTDIQYSAATGTTNTLTVFAGNELHVASSTTFTPGGDITINANASSSVQDGSLHIDDNADFIGSATSTYRIGGSFTMDVGATFTAASTSVIMNATTTGKTITTPAPQEITFNALTFVSTAGGWNINGKTRVMENMLVASGTVTGTSDVTVVNGSLSGNGVLSFGSGTTTIERSNTLGGTTAWTFANLVLGNATVVGTTTPGGATTTILGKLTIANAHFLDGNSSIWNFAGTGNVFVENGTFLEDTTTVRYSGAGATNVLGTTYYNLDLKAVGGSPAYTATGIGMIVSNDLTVGGSSATTFTLDTNDTVLDINGNVYIASTGALQGSNSASTTIAGSWDNDGVFTGNGGTITFDNGGTKTIAAGASLFSNVVINGAGTFTISEHATTTGSFTLTNATAFTVASGQILAIGGVFTNSIGGAATTWTGATLALYGGGNYTMNAKSVTDSYDTLMVRANTDIRMWNSTATTYAVDGTGSLYSQDHGNVDGDLYVYGNYPGNGGTDFWNYATDFDGASLSGSERNVDVYFASGASMTLTSGGLAVVGIGSASTTIQNQGAGTYGLRIGGTASTTWSYYQVRNVDSAGLTFSGTPNVTTLSNGNVQVSQNGATALTVGGTVITQNPAKTFTNTFFGTSTGVSPAYNVTATGTSVSSWRFTNHNGSIDGEAFDVDPNGDPGYIVWDDSAALITISGTVYVNEGSGVSTACDGATNNIVLRVAGLTSYSTNCSVGTGAYSISNVAYSPGDSFVVYIDNETEKAATVSEDPISNVGNMDLYEDRVIVRHENTDPLSILDMSVWDSSDDADIPFTAVDAGTDTLTLPSNRKLLVWTSKTFQPAGNVTLTGAGAGAAYDGTLELYSNASFIAAGSESHSVGGSLITGTGATFTSANSTVTFTTTGSARTVDTNAASFYNVTFSGSGSWTVSDTSMSIGNDFTITQGAVTLPNGTTTVTGSFNVTGGSWNANGGTMLFNSGAAETIRAGGSNFNALTINGAGSFTMLGTNATTTSNLLIKDGTFTSATGTLTIGGNFINSDVFTHGSGILRFIATTSTAVTAFGSDLYSTTFAGSGPYTFTDLNEALLGSLTIASGTVNLATGTMSVAGSFLNTGGSFNHGSGTILFNSSDVGETVNPGSSPFYVVAFASAGGGWTISGNATTTSNFSLTSASTFTLASSTRLAVGGIFTNLVGGAPTTWTGSTLVLNSGSSYTINTKTTGGDTYNNLRIGSSTALRSWDSTGSITMLDSASSFYSQDHAGVSGSLYIYGNYTRTTGSDYWSYANDFDGASLGGSPRQVYVYIANGATSTVSGGTLNIVGANGFDTTISNQGSGTYAMSVLGGSLNAQYYSFLNMNTNGLSLSGLTTIVALTEGNFTLAVNGGALITLSSTTLNYNAGLVSVGNTFATTTAITGANVKLVGTTPSVWTFTGHSGNFDGEVFDNDGIDDCGSLRWDDSLCLITSQSAYRFRNDDGGEGVPSSEWYDGSWSKRKRVEFTNADSQSYTNAALKVTVTYDTDMQADFDDLRFTSSNGTTLLNHFIESYSASTEAIVWVEVPLLATSTETAVYVYYGNGGASDTSSTSTFNFIDTFEDGNISEYSGDTSLFAVDGSFAKERANGLDTTGNESAKATDGIYRTDVSVAQGETIRYFQYIDTSAGSGDETCTMFGVQTPGSNNQNYAVCLEQYGVDRVSLARDVDWNDASGVILASTTITYSTGWYEVEVDWNTSNLITVTVLKDGAVVATTSATNSNYTSGGVGFTFWFQHGGWDMYMSRPLLTTEPATSFGFEQVSGGASWIAALNTPGSGIEIGERARLRFLVENSGLPVTNQNYELEYAEKGAAPSCEAVDYSDFVEVPNIASCGTSDICMESSSNFTNLASTTDILGGRGTFTYGQMVEDASNNTGNITLNGSEYTELEYVITPTANVSDSSFCLRVSNEGADLDSYTRVAELSLLFAPNITALSLNGGLDITLTGGATTTVYATGTVSDLNGYTDLVGATSTVFRSGVGESCSLDNNSCYISGNSKCSFVNCSGNSCDVSCRADIYYHADPTDIGTFAGETWRALLAVSDLGGSVATATAPSIDLVTLRAISVDSAINYGALAVNADTGSYNATTTVQNIGNDALDIAIEGTDLTDGGTSIIPVNEQKFATSTFTYSACTYCSALSTAPANYELNLNKPASTTPAVTDELFWGIFVPFGVAGTSHQGTNIFYAIGD